ncbi:MAG TPA: hypothetical protein DDY39_06165 [Nitrospira sp.]|nr:hypothetical protein [Nitrospira sp.]
MFNVLNEGFMSVKTGVIVVGSTVLLVSALVGGAWVVTAPPDNVEPWKQKTCDEHVQQLDMLNRYKLFWSFVQRRQGFNDCLKRVEELGMKPPSE